MKKRKVALASLVFAVVFILGVGVSFAFHAVDATSDDLLLASSNVSYTYNYEAENGMKGICVSTENSTATAKFGNVYDGSFELTFLPVATGGSFNYQRFHIDFQPVAGGNYFRFTYLLGEATGGSAAAALRCYWGETPINGTTVEYQKAEKVTVGFDSETMTMFYLNGEEKVVLMDFHDASAMVKAFSTHNTIADAERYTVSLSFEGAQSGKKSSVLLSEINGQKLTGKPIMNSKGADVVSAQLYGGVVGMKYTVNVSDIVACDALEGVLTFDGKISAYEPDGTEIEVVNGSFTPERVGMYTVGLRAKDSDGLTGEEKKFGVSIVSEHVATEPEFDFPMEDITVGTNTDVQLSAASAYSRLFGGNLPVSVTVTCGGSVVYECEDMKNGHIFTPEENGTYTVTYAVTDSVGETLTKIYTVTVSDGYSLKLSDPLKEVYVAGNYFTVPSIETNAESFTTLLVMPDGRSTSSQNVKLETLGVYTLQYILTGAKGTNTVAYSFEVKIRASELFETERSMEVENAALVPEYMDAQVKGAMLTGSLIKASATYKNAIDLGNKTKSDLLAEFYICPEERLSLELMQFSVRLTDLYDETNYVTLKIRRQDWGYNAHIVANASVGENGSFGFAMVQSSVYGKYKAFTDGVYNYDVMFSSTIRIYWDNSENAFYIGKDGGRALVADLDDPDTVGVNVFKGFTTGEVKMSVIFDEPQQTAHLLVCELAGQSFCDEYVEDRVAPTVSVQWSGDTPYACVDKAYTLFGAYGVDAIDGILNAQPTVYFRNNGMRERIVVSDGKFTPRKAGIYELVYKTVNSAGQTAQKTILVEAKDVRDIAPLTMTVPEYESTAVQGETLTVGLPSVSGGSGYAVVKVTVSCNGTEIASFAEESGKIELNESGVYEIDYSATDLYTGFTASQKIAVTVNASEKPVFEELRLPTAFIAGKKYTLPMATAYDYSSGTKANASVKLYVNDEEKNAAETLSFDAGTVVIEYRATNADGATDRLTFRVPVIDVKNSGKGVYLAGYFLYDESVEVNAGALSLSFLSDKDTEIRFINRIAVDVFSIDFSVLAQYANMNGIELVLTDSENPTQNVVLTIGKIEGADATSSLKINGVACNPIAGAIGGSGTKGSFSLKLVGNSLVDGNGTAQTLLNGDGSVFGGFDSGYVYADFRIVGAEEGKTSAITLSSIVNQAFGNASSDRGKPNIVLKNDLPLIADIGTVIDLSGASAYDVLDPETKFYISVTCSGKSVLSEREYTDKTTINLDTFGKYTVLFRAVDSSGREYEAPYVINVYDREPPVITVTKDRVETAKVGETVELAGYECSCSVSVAVIGPNGVIEIVTDGRITVSSAGTYRVYYYATNGDGAVGTASYDIQVK